MQHARVFLVPGWSNRSVLKGKTDLSCLQEIFEILYSINEGTWTPPQSPNYEHGNWELGTGRALTFLGQGHAHKLAALVCLMFKILNSFLLIKCKTLFLFLKMIIIHSLSHTQSINYTPNAHFPIFM